MVLKDPVRFSSAAAGWGGGNPLATARATGEQSKAEQGLSRTLAQSFNQMDPPDHTRIRALVVSAFSRRNIEERKDRIAAVIDELLDAAAAKGRFDLITDFAFHVPIIVASEIIGIPAGDREAFRAAFEQTAALMAPKRSEESWAQALEAGRWVGRYMRALIGERRAEPRDDLVSALIAAEDARGALSEAELSSAISTLYTAAGTTTERFISSGMYLLLSHPEQWRALVADRALVGPADGGDPALPSPDPIDLNQPSLHGGRGAARQDPPRRRHRPRGPGRRQPGPGPVLRSRPFRHHPQDRRCRRSLSGPVRTSASARRSPASRPAWPSRPIADRWPDLRLVTQFAGQGSPPARSLPGDHRRN